MSAELTLLSILFCFVVSAFFSGTESGVLSINHARLMHFVRAGLKQARLLNDYLSDMQRFMGTILVGNNLANVALSTLSASLAHRCFPGNHVMQTAWAVVMASMILFFCEYLPKLFFTTRPLRRTMLVARVFFLVEKLLKPLTLLVLLFTQWLVPKSRKGSTGRFLMTREFIQHVVSDPKEGSRITAVERLMINRVLALQAQRADQIMTPMESVSSIAERATLEMCYRLVRDSGHVRLPVFSEDGARCVGVINVPDVLTGSPDPERTLVADCMQQPFFVSADEHADDVLPLMRTNRQPMAMVKAEDGSVKGIITEENVLFALTGSMKKAGV